ncbi:MAG TPA: formate dehydrogenase accessory sulfurtransferase FdhD [Acidimicrobiales bacterium]|nr:formate dehydrogenase accessory sulfurtransferase FdhD [Acidimicrobiales bacterium]
MALEAVAGSARGAARDVRGEDLVATEEPLEIRLVRGSTRLPVAVTMRTPGADFELAAGFLFNEGVVRTRSDIHRLSYCVDKELSEEQLYNIVNVEVTDAVGALDVARLERHFSMTSACGVCGKATLAALRSRGYERLPPGLIVTSEAICALPEKLRRGQKLFETTGGVHAAGLFGPDGEPVAVREDVGRHNAMDKLVGRALLDGRLPLSGCMVLVSGRASFELVQKALAAGVPLLCSVSAPSSLAVQLASHFGMTLASFVRPGRFKLYSGPERVKLP